MSDDAKKPSLSLDDVQKCFECPICFIIPHSMQIYQCENGHILCSTCHAKLAKCPQCREPLSKIRSLIAEHLLEKFLPGCAFAKHGCTAKLLPTTRDLHKKNCAVREVPCPSVGCKENVSLWYILGSLNF